MNFKTIGLLVDYRDGYGRYYNKALNVCALGDYGIHEAIQSVREQVEAWGFQLCAVTHVEGMHTLEELEVCAVNPLALGPELTMTVYAEPWYKEEVMREQRKGRTQ